jgi:serine/threonine protein kinase
VWAFGVTLFELVTGGSPPYEGFNGAEVAAGVVAGDLVLVETLIKKQQPIHRYLLLLMTDCMQRTPENRPTFEVIQSRLQ